MRTPGVLGSPPRKEPVVGEDPKRSRARKLNEDESFEEEKDGFKVKWG